MKTRLLTVILIATISTTALAASAEAKDRFSLAGAVPANAWMYVHVANNAERDFLDKHWGRVFAAVKKAKLDQDIKRLIAETLDSEEDRAEFKKFWDNAVELFHAVKWGDLAANELVVMSTQIAPLPNYTVLFKPRLGTLEHNVAGMKAIFEEIAGFSEDIDLRSESLHGAQMWTLGFSDDEEITLHLFHRDAVVGLSLGRTGAESALGLLAGASETGRLIDTARYKQAVKDVPQAEDAISFVDMARLMKQVRKTISVEIAEDHHGDGAEHEHTAEQLIDNIFNQVDILDYIVSSEQTDGLQTASHTVIKLTDDSKDKPLRGILTGQAPVSDVSKYVPENATGYWAWSGIDLEGAYNLVLDFIKENIPDGPAHVADWKQNLQEVNFSPESQVFGWFEGQVMAVTFPPAIQTGMGGTDVVFMLKAKDGEKAKQAIGSAIDAVGGGPQGGAPQGAGQGGVRVAPAADVQADGFRSITHPMLAMMMVKITYGVYGDWLMISNSTSAINQVLACAKGEAPSFFESERFAKEGLKPAGAVAFASFSDLRTWGPDMAMQLMMLPMAVAFIPRSPETAPIRAGLSMLGKLSPALSKIDFMLSTSTVCTYENDRWISKTVTNYREYKAPSTQPAQPTRKSKVKKKLEGL